MAEDIKKNGLIERITLLDGKVLDGRNRYNACKLAGRHLAADDIIQFEEEYEGQDPAAFVISMNIRRRHLTVGQRAAVAAELYKRLAKEKDGTSSKQKVKKVAEIAQVAASSVEQAAHIEKVAPDLHQEIKAGKKTLHKAAKEAAKKATGTGHDEALLRIKDVCGKHFEAAIRENQISALNNAKTVIGFAGLKDEQMKAIAPVLRQGWKLRRAIEFLDKEVTPASSAAQIIDLAVFKNVKKYEFELDGWKFAVSKVVVKDGEKPTDKPS